MMVGTAMEVDGEDGAVEDMAAAEAGTVEVVEDMAVGEEEVGGRIIDPLFLAWHLLLLGASMNRVLTVVCGVRLMRFVVGIHLLSWMILSLGLMNGSILHKRMA